MLVPENARTTLLLNNLEQTGRTHAAADAHGDDRVPGLAATALDQRVTGEPRARHPIGMADRNRAAIDVKLLRVDAELVATVDHLHGKGFVQFPEIDVLDLETVALEQPRHREYRPDAHFIRLAAGGNETAENAERLQALLRGELVAHDHRGAGAVGKLAGIAGGDAKTLAAHRLEACEAFSGGIRPRTFILRERDFLEGNLAGCLVGDAHLGGDRRQLVVEFSALLRGGRAALAFERIFVLALARDAVALRHRLGGVEHRHVDVLLDCHQFGIDRVECIGVIVLHQADRFAAAADRYLDAVE